MACMPRPCAKYVQKQSCAPLGTSLFPGSARGAKEQRRGRQHHCACLSSLAGFHQAPTRAGGALAPEREDLLTQQGGALVLGGAPERQVLFSHADRGILDTVDVDQLRDAALAALPKALPGV